ncbi:uncharacterized protein LOC127798771 [Diospyros lotus]|uniref:uncharacterized protein LOC127798771 n=1 Tax=Diospyros lotus TaxID=55363 RepID=UPI00225BE7D8|nr:uncharacterized protein LOC127798771 [Diospyros lotus]
MGKSTEDAYELLEEMASNNYQWSTERGMPKKASGMYEVDGINMLNAKVDNLVKIFGKLGNGNAVYSNSNSASNCDWYENSHLGSDCMQVEQAQYISNYNMQNQQNNPYSNSYNAGWRNHPNFSWRDQGSSSNSRPNNPPGFQPRPQGVMQQQPESKPSWELAIEKLANATANRFEKLEEKVDQMANFNRNLEVQLGQISNAINSRDQGKLPSKTEVNPREEVKAVTLRSGKQLGEVSSEHVTGDIDKKNNVEISDENEKNEIPSLTPLVKPYVPPIPFPQRLKQNKVDKQFENFLEVFKQLRINIPFADALAQIPAYAKFLKEIMSNKRKLEDYKTIALTKECSAMIQTNCLRNSWIQGAFLFLALLGVVEDILVKVDKFIFLVDFIVLDMEEDYDMPLILGRHFLATGRALINVQQGTLSLRIYDETVTFNVFKATKHSNGNEKEVLRIDDIDDLAERLDEPIENCIANFFDEQEQILNAKNKAGAMGYLEKKQKGYPSKRDNLLLLDVSSPSSKAKPPSCEKEKLIRVLREQKKGIGWKVVNIQGISPSTDMHKILTEEGFKPP